MTTKVTATQESWRSKNPRNQPQLDQARGEPNRQLSWGRKLKGFFYEKWFRYTPSCFGGRVFLTGRRLTRGDWSTCLLLTCSWDFWRPLRRTLCNCEARPTSAAYWLGESKAPCDWLWIRRRSNRMHIGEIPSRKVNHWTGIKGEMVPERIRFIGYVHGRKEPQEKLLTMSFLVELMYVPFYRLVANGFSILQELHSTLSKEWGRKDACPRAAT